MSTIDQATPGAFPDAAPDSIRTAIEGHAARHPDAPAVIFDARAIAYAELNARANRLADQLCLQGVGPDVPVGLFCARGPEAIVGLLAILKADGACVPLDPAYPAERLRLMASVAGLRLVVTTENLVESVPFTGATVELARADGPCPRTPDLESRLRAANLAYILFTSGSTGTPKGVAMPHAVLENLVAWQARVLPVDAGTRTLQYAPLSFDVSFQEIASTLAGGGTLVLVREETRRDPAALLGLVRAQSVTRLFLPVVMLQELTAQFARDPQPLPALRDVITAGEQLRVTPAVRAFFAAHPGCRLHNHYGPTETHVVTAATLAGAPDSWPELPPIGTPITGAAIYLLDDAGQPVDDGVEGELFIGGRVLARGYHRDPQNSRARFVPDRFNAGDRHARLYRTGDLARRRPDGQFEYLGRRDDQVKVRGFRVELGEVEAALGRHASVAQCAVVAIDKGAGDRHLAACVIPFAGAAIDPAALRDHLAKTLPPHAMPGQFHQIDALPLTPSGKVDRRTLAATLATRAPAAAAGVTAPPRTPLERAVAATWADCLGTSDLGVDENVFDRGATSLTVVRAHQRLQSELGREFPVTLLFEHVTVRALAHALTPDTAMQSSADASSSPSPTPSATVLRARRQREALDKRAIALSPT